MEIGKRFLSARNRKRFDQKEAAFKLGISASYLSYIENGKKRPSIDLITKASEVYNVDPGYFFDGYEYNIEDILTENNQGFIADLGELSIDEIQRKYHLKLDGVAIDESELSAAIAFLRTLRKSR